MAMIKVIERMLVSGKPERFEALAIHAAA